MQMEAANPPDVEQAFRVRAFRSVPVPFLVLCSGRPSLFRHIRSRFGVSAGKYFIHGPCAYEANFIEMNPLSMMVNLFFIWGGCHVDIC